MVFVTYANAASLTDLENQRDQLTRNADRVADQANQAKQQVSTLSDQVDNLSRSISSAQSQINNLQSQINSTESNIADLNKQIDQTNADLVVQKNNQDSALRTIYETTGDDLPAILTGGNISDSVDKSAYLEALETSIEASTKHINDLQASLTKQKNDLADKQKSLSDAKQGLIDQKSGLAAQKAQQTNLLNLTADQANAYNAQLKEMKGDIANLSSAIIAKRRALSSSGSIQISNVAGSGGYPYGGAQDSYADPWGFYNRECVSYAAWYWNDILHKSFDNTNPRYGSGNAYNWAYLAQKQGYGVYSSPQKGDVIVWPNASPYGHVAIVQDPDAGGGQITVSQYNFYGDGQYSVMTLNPGKLGSYSYLR